MMPYKPLKVAGNSTGLVQSREEHLLPDDAYPILENAYVWRERIVRKQGTEFLGRFRRILTAASLGTITSSGAGMGSLNIFTALGIASTEPNAQMELGNVTTITITIAAPFSQTLTDNTGTGVFTIAPAGIITAATINYQTGEITFTFSGAGGPSAVTITGAYYPSLPVMGLRDRETSMSSIPTTVGFDTKYAYRYTSSGWVEFISGAGSTTWTGDDDNFFWSTNYWVSAANAKLFWTTNFSGQSGDPIRYTDGVTWTDFTPTIDGSANVLAQCLALVPYRGRLLAANTLEGANLATSQNYRQRLRWSAIGSPLTMNAWLDDIRGQGGFLDIPTSQNITAIGFVRDNLVVYCEGSTWQLRYTGRSIAPFQIEKVNTELGAESLFSAVQFDTFLAGIGDKGIVQCDSFKSERFDIKIVALVFSFNNENNGPTRIQGIRDFVKKLAYWTYPFIPDEVPSPSGGIDVTYPNRRLVYNYENDSWAIFIDSFTALGNFRPPSQRTWQNTKIPWEQCDFPWADQQFTLPDIIGGNQQGYVSILDQQVGNGVSLFIQNITGNTTTPTVITSPNHNLEPEQIIQIQNIPVGTPFAASLNGNIFSIIYIDVNNFSLKKFNPVDQQFSLDQLDPPAVYIGGGEIVVLDNFYIESKKFNFMDEGQNIQIGFIDVLMPSTNNGEITLNVLANYNETDPVNVPQQNVVPATQQPDSFFNFIVSTDNSNPSNVVGTKYWQRVFCPVRSNFLTIVWTLSNAQMVSVAQTQDVQIDAQVIWRRQAGRMTNI